MKNNRFLRIYYRDYKRKIKGKRLTKEEMERPLECTCIPYPLIVILNISFALKVAEGISLNKQLTTTKKF